MPSGGSGRGQGAALTTKGLGVMIARIRRAVDRLEARRELPDTAIAFAVVNLNIQVGRLLALANIERPPSITQEQRDEAHVWAEAAAADEEEAEDATEV